MSPRVVWHPAAQSELDADIEWYEARHLGLGDRFERTSLDVIEDLVGAPHAGPVWPGWARQPFVRSRAVGGFPYRVVYLHDDHTLTIVAVAHTKRMPGYWRDRVPG